jgi:hypothetical protein
MFSFLTGTPMDQTSSPDTINLLGRNRGDVVGDIHLSGSERSIDRWYNVDAFVHAPAGEWPTAGRNLIIGPGWKNMDLLASKSFGMPWEDHSLQFRFEAFNLTNTPNFGTPGLNFTRPTAGVITSASEPRLIQLGLRYLF